MVLERSRVPVKESFAPLPELQMSKVSVEGEAAASPNSMGKVRDPICLPKRTCKVHPSANFPEHPAEVSSEHAVPAQLQYEWVAASFHEVIAFILRVLIYATRLTGPVKTRSRS